MNASDKQTIETARALCNEANPPPWLVGCESAGCQCSSAIVDAEANRLLSVEGSDPGNAHFVAASRTLVPQLCDIAEDQAKLLEQQAARIAEIERALELHKRVVALVEEAQTADANYAKVKGMGTATTGAQVLGRRVLDEALHHVLSATLPKEKP